MAAHTPPPAAIDHSADSTEPRSAADGGGGTRTTRHTNVMLFWAGLGGFAGTIVLLELGRRWLLPWLLH